MCVTVIFMYTLQQHTINNSPVKFIKVHANTLEVENKLGSIFRNFLQKEKLFCLNKNPVGLNLNFTKVL